MITEEYFFLFLIETICCDQSSDPSHLDGSAEESQHMFYAELIKIISNYHQIPLLISSSPFYLQLIYIS